MNKAILIGRLTRDPDIRYTQGEQSMAIARFTLAVNRRYIKGNEQQADFISCVAFGKTAEFIEKYAHQGTKLVTEGRIQTGSYTNKDGVKVYTTDVVVESCEFAENKKAAGDEVVPVQPANTNPQDGFMMIPDGVEDDGLPFA